MRFFSMIVLGMVLVSFYSCDKNRVYENFYSTGANGWDKDSVAKFQFDIADIETRYNLYINTRNSEQYPYSNLWLFVEVIAPDHTAIRDTVEYQLALTNGKWSGKGTGGIYLSQLPYRINVFFPVEGTYQVNIQHAMRDEQLKGLTDIGIRIEKR